MLAEFQRLGLEGPLKAEVAVNSEEEMSFLMESTLIQVIFVDLPDKVRGAVLLWFQYHPPESK